MTAGWLHLMMRCTDTLVPSQTFCIDTAQLNSLYRVGTVLLCIVLHSMLIIEKKPLVSIKMLWLFMHFLIHDGMFFYVQLKHSCN